MNETIRSVFVVGVTKSVITLFCNTVVPEILKLNQQDSNAGK